MKTLGIRQWLLLGIVIFLGSAALLYHLAGAFDEGLLQSLRRQQTQQQNAALDRALRAVTDHPAAWRDPTWQQALRDHLALAGIQALVRDPAGREIFRTGSIAPGTAPTRQAAVLTVGTGGAQSLGTVDLFLPPRGDLLPPLVFALSVTIALLFVYWQLGRYVVKPLEAMSVAARRIASGNLDFALPESRVREVAAVREAFEAMGEGLRGSITRQAQLEEERRFFIGAIAHDLRTPLFSLRGYLEGFERGLAASPEKAAHYIAVCRQKADQLERLIADLFAYAKVEYLTPALQQEPLELGVLLRRTVEGARARAQARGVTLELDGTLEACPTRGDEYLLERAVENLLENALRYTPPGGVIKVSWRCVAERVVFTVADTGPGIPAAEMPHLFDPLFRGETSRNRQTGGAGLGLAIALRALIASGGDLVARNREGGGAEFTGWLPACASALSVLKPALYPPVDVR
jgi:signal transduction histidine kinase